MTDMNDFEAQGRQASENDSQPKKVVLTRAKALCVVLDEDLEKRDPELKALADAIRMLKHVAAVSYIDLDSHHDYPDRVRSKIELAKQIKEGLDLKEWPK